MVPEWMLTVRVFAGTCFAKSEWPTMIWAAEVSGVVIRID